MQTQWRTDQGVILGLDYNAIEWIFNLKKKNNYKLTKIKLINTDAVKYKIKNENVFLFFNPFSNKILDKILINILKTKKKKIYIIFAGPKLTNKILKKKFKIILKKNFNTYNCSLFTNL